MRKHRCKVLRKQVPKSLNGCFYKFMGKKVLLFSKKRRHGTGCRYCAGIKDLCVVCEQ